MSEADFNKEWLEAVSESIQKNFDKIKQLEKKFDENAVYTTPKEYEGIKKQISELRRMIGEKVTYPAPVGRDQMPSAILKQTDSHTECGIRCYSCGKIVDRKNCFCLECLESTKKTYLGGKE